MQPRSRTTATSSMPARRIFVLVLVLTSALAVLVGVGAMFGQMAETAAQNTNSTPTAKELSRTTAFSMSDRPATPRVATGAVDSLGRPVSISCGSCHSNFKPNLEIRSGAQLKQFHQGLVFTHGKLTCLTCHNAPNYNLLRLAGEQPLDFSEAQTLCSQCHSKQSNDYEHGAHGGMNGHWNLARGARVRKQCIDCHDPHAPAFPAMVPTFKPHDRFLEPNHANQAESDHE